MRCLQSLIPHDVFHLQGMSKTVHGPALPELEILTARTTADLSWMLGGRAAGMLVGSLMCGALAGRVSLWRQVIYGEFSETGH